MERAIQERRTRRIAANILILLPGLALATSSVLKFAGVPVVVHQMAAMGFSGGRYTLVATLELLSAALFLYPRTRSAGVLFLSAFLGGVICTHVQMGELPKGIPAAMLLIFAWAGTWLQNPEMLWSFQKAVPAGDFWQRNLRFSDTSSSSLAELQRLAVSLRPGTRCDFSPRSYRRKTRPKPITESV